MVMRISVLKLNHGELISLSKHITTLQSLLQFHAVTVTTGNSTNPFIAAKLISLYDNLNHPSSSSTLFHSLPFKDTFLWNSFLKTLFSRSLFPQLLSFYSLMRSSNVLPNHFTFPMIASSYAHLLFLPYGMTLHGLAYKVGFFSSSSAVGSSFVSLYSRCGEMNNAVKVFDEIPVRDVVAWTALVIGYVQNGESEMGLKCISEMYRVDDDAQRPNSRTLEGGFLACGNLGDLFSGRCLHGLVVKNGIGCFLAIQSSILSMYCKCGVPEEAYRSFCEVIDKDLLSWTSIIGVYARFGMMSDCVRLFWEMRGNQVCPDGIVIGCILSGFGNYMYVFGGKAFHGLIIRRHYVPDEMVDNSLLFMYCKFGMLSFAERLFDPCQGSIECWNFMVAGYGRIGKNIKCIEHFREMQYLGIRSESVGVVSAIVSCGQLREINLGRSIHCNVIKGFVDETISVTNSLIEIYGKCDKMNVAWILFNSLIFGRVTGNFWAEEADALQA
ncbi:hypothetical protein TSUD_257870 [Trifolium subterraneum]|uniref:Pentatricopeptide repeat-containing protein n=1 Tax=Trifolium subterraneum TaxID=3900 RepID=A0A2Z6M4M4_TRISU|nr:hypothetical protein TSUD_257870 [Trifolium subterraneum]